MVIGMTGSLASLGDTLFPADSLRHAVVQDFSSSSHTLLRLRVLHPIAAVIGSIYVLWLLRRSGEKRERSAMDVPSSRHTDCPDCARRNERDPVGTCLAADDASTGCRNLLDPARTGVRRSGCLPPTIRALPLSRKSTGANWALASKLRTISAAAEGPLHETTTSDC